MSRFVNWVIAPAGIIAILAGAADRTASAALCADGTNQPVCTFTVFGSYFESSGPPQRGTTFQTWPDGSPTVPGQVLTPEMNYTQIGVTFSAPVRNPFINNFAPFQVLEVNSGSFEPDWINADFVVPASAVGIDFPYGTTLYAYDAGGQLLASVEGFLPGGQDAFLGIVSDIPIAKAVINEGTFADIIDTFFFNPIPEPASAIFFGVGLATILPGRRRRARGMDR